jgi:hypothetical protein
VFSPGLSGEIRFLDHFSFELLFMISPLSFCAGFDEHLTSRVQYRDYPRWGLYLEPRGRFSFSPFEWLDISLAAGWRLIEGAKGPIHQQYMGSGDYAMALNEAGAGFSALDAGLFLKLRL